MGRLQTRVPRQMAPFHSHVSGREQRRRNFEAERCRGLQVYCQFDLCRMLDRQFGGLRAPQDTINVIGGPAECTILSITGSIKSFSPMP